MGNKNVPPSFELQLACGMQKKKGENSNTLLVDRAPFFYFRFLKKSFFFLRCRLCVPRRLFLSQSFKVTLLYKQDGGGNRKKDEEKKRTHSQRNQEKKRWRRADFFFFFTFKWRFHNQTVMQTERRKNLIYGKSFNLFLLVSLTIFSELLICWLIVFLPSLVSVWKWKQVLITLININYFVHFSAHFVVVTERGIFIF